MDKGRFPDFLLIGAPKCGTTALWRALDAHPGIFMSKIKEPGFLAYGDKLPNFHCPGSAPVLSSLVCNEQEYKKLFAQCPTDRKAGEATPIYLAHPDAPARAAQLVPSAKLVAVLRDPIERAFSHWVYYRMKGIETYSTLEGAMEAEVERLRHGWRLGWGYQLLGLYGQQLERWLRFYPREKLLIVFYEDLVRNPAETLNRICLHVGAAPTGAPKVPNENRSFAPRSARLQQLIMGDNCFRRFARQSLPIWIRDAIMWPMLVLNLRRKAKLDLEVKKRLAPQFENDIRLVEQLTERNLGSWKAIN